MKTHRSEQPFKRYFQSGHRYTIYSGTQTRTGEYNASVEKQSPGREIFGINDLKYFPKRREWI